MEKKEESKTINLDSDGNEIKPDTMYIYHNKNGGMCSLWVENRGGVLWGCGPWTEYPLQQWLSALDFERIEIDTEFYAIESQEITDDNNLPF